MIEIRTITEETTRQTILVNIKERIGKPYLINSPMKPSVDVHFVKGYTRNINGVLAVTIFATITLTTPSEDGCGEAMTQVFTEKFNVAFLAQGSCDVSISVGTEQVVEPDFFRCCKAKGVSVFNTLVLDIV